MLWPGKSARVRILPVFCLLLLLMSAHAGAAVQVSVEAVFAFDVVTAPQHPAEAKPAAVRHTLNDAIRWIEAAAKAAASEAWGWLTHAYSLFDQVAGVIFKVAKDLLGILAVVLIPYLIYLELRRDVLILDPFSVPKRLEERGLTGEVIAHRVRDALLQMQAETKTSMKKSNLSAARDEGAMPDMEISGTKMGVKTVADLLRSLLGKNLKHASGDIVFSISQDNTQAGDAGDAVVTLYVTTGRERSPAVRVLAPDDDIPLLIQRTAVAVLEQVNPYVAGCFHLEHRSYEKTLEAVQCVLRDGSSSRRHRSAAHNLWGIVLHDLKRYNEAIEQYRKGVEVDPKYAAAYINWGGALSALKKHGEAIKLYRKAVEIDPKDATAYNNRGGALQELKKHDEAIEQYRKAVKIDPKHANAYYNWGNALCELEKYDEGIGQYQKVVEIDPKYARAYKNWGLALCYLEKYDEAIEQSRKAVEIDPKYADAYNNWGNALSALTKYDGAVEQFRKAIEVDPKYESAYRNLAIALGHLGKAKEAAEAQRKADELSGSQ
jgi:tetratricopeptide (TPR) repeat protein